MHKGIQQLPIFKAYKNFVLVFIITSVFFTNNCAYAKNTSTQQHKDTQSDKIIADNNIKARIELLEKQIDELKKAQKEAKKNVIPEPEGNDKEKQASTMAQSLDISGFFDVKARANNDNGQPFELGALEMDIQYDKIENVAVSAALVWDGDEAAVAVAFLDYHVGSHDAPTRGKLFGEAGYHIQLGRFDIPFGVDYEYFAAPDRTNITAPLTTELIQNGGFNSDGGRTYGTWSQFDYALYWTNSVFESTGTTVGSRVGIFPSRDPFSVHHRDDQNNIVLGVSWLYDMDADQNKRNEMYAVDLTWKYWLVGFIAEYITIDKVDAETLIKTTSEDGYNLRFTFDFEPLTLYFSYGEWQQNYINDTFFAETTIHSLNRITVAANYIVADYLQMKLEYLTHIDDVPLSLEFEKNTFTFQLVASF